MGLFSVLTRAADGVDSADAEQNFYILGGAAVVALGFIAHRIFIANPAQRRDDNRRFAKKAQTEMTLLLARMRPPGAATDWPAIADTLKQRGVVVDLAVLAATSVNFGYTEGLYINELRNRLKTVDRGTRDQLAEAAIVIGDVIPSAGAPETVNRLLATFRAR